MSVKLLYRDDQGRDADADLPMERAVYLGRGPECIVRTDDPEVGVRSARLRLILGQWYVEDLGTPTGTRVNEQVVHKQALAHADVVRCGSLQVRFVNMLDASAQTPRAAGPSPAERPTNAEAADPLVGKVLAERFEIIARIGEGGSSVVYKARELDTDRMIALKVLAANVNFEPRWQTYFRQEALTMQRLDHPHIVRIIDSGESPEGLQFIVMELLEGSTLLQELLRLGRLPAERALRIVSQLCLALKHAHGQAVLHRDLRPSKLFLLSGADADDFIKVIDWGTPQGDGETVFGVPAYMSPECARGLPLTPRSDIYACGVTLYEMLSGKVPFEAPTPMETVMKHLREPPPALTGVAEPLVQLVLKALEKAPEQRHQSALELHEECQVCQDELLKTRDEARLDPGPRKVRAQRLAPAGPPPPLTARRTPPPALTVAAPRPEANKLPYDVFVSYCPTDQEWVRLELVPRLESAALKVCLDERDFVLGVPVLNNLESAVKSSRYTLLVLTQAWLEGEWAQLAAQLTQVMDPSGRHRKLIPVQLQHSLTKPEWLSRLTYVDLSADDQLQQWDRLLHQLGRPSHL